MTKEQFDQLLGAVNGLGTKIEGFSAKPEVKNDPVTDQSAEGDKANIAADQFNKLDEAITSLAATVGELKGQIDKFSVEVDGQRPDPLGGDDTTYKIC